MPKLPRENFDHSVKNLDVGPGPPATAGASRPMKFATALLFLVCVLVASTTANAKSRQPIIDSEVSERKAACYADIQSGLWGWQCKSSTIAKENCALRCLSAPCYDLVYEGDPLEEGEIDYIRGREFKYCMHRLSQGENLDGVKGAFDY